MPLDLGQVPTDDLINALIKRYPNFLMAGANEGFVSDHISDCFFIEGNILINLGLWDLMHQHLLGGFKENIVDGGHDAP